MVLNIDTQSITHEEGKDVLMSQLNLMTCMGDEEDNGILIIED